MSTQLGKLSVGSTVFLNVDGGKREFLIVNQGLPSLNYADSCDGTWLLMKDIYEQRAWSSNISTSQSYPKSTIHNYLNSRFLELLDPDIQNVIKLVEIPCANTSDVSGPITKPTTSGSITGSITSGSNVLMTKIFLLSLAETGLSRSYITTEGSILEYFTPSNYDTRIGYYEGKAQGWWLRSIYTRNNNDAAYIDTSGDVSHSTVTNNGTYCGVRPAMILPSVLMVDDDGFVKSGSAPIGVQGSVTIDGMRRDLTGESYVNINGVWKPIVKSYTCIDSVWKSSNGK